MDLKNLNEKFSFKLDIQSKIRDIISEKLQENEHSLTKTKTKRLNQDLLIQELKKKGMYFIYYFSCSFFKYFLKELLIRS